VNEQVVDSMMINGFKNVILMGDHGGGQKELRSWPNGWTQIRTEGSTFISAASSMKRRGSISTNG